MQEALIVRRETHLPAPPAAVFALLTDPEKILRWMGTEAQVEPQPGGLYLVNVTGARFARGSFREVVPVHRLAYSFGWDGSEVVPPGSSLVEIDLIEQPDGTLLRFTHSGLPNAEQCAGHAEGWAHYLDRLVEVAAGRDLACPDPPARGVRQEADRPALDMLSAACEPSLSWRTPPGRRVGGGPIDRALGLGSQPDRPAAALLRIAAWRE
jgi:uncharacterized protein YndB with AHSA1/START domain